MDIEIERPLYLRQCFIEQIRSVDVLYSCIYLVFYGPNIHCIRCLFHD